MDYLAHSAKDGYPEQPYAEHIGHVLQRAERYAREAAAFNPLDGGKLIHVASQAASWHDLGKLDEQNQQVLHTNSRPTLPVHHQDAGAAYLLQKDAVCSAWMVYTHHTGLCNFPAEENRHEDYLRDAQASTRQLTDAELPQLVRLHQATAPSADATPDEPIEGDGAVFLRMALSCLADADHSDTSENYGKPVRDDDAVPLRAEERLQALDAYVEGLSRTSQDNERSRLRREMYRACQGTVIQGGFASCDSPVGSGKTTAVMAHLLRQAMERHARRIFVVLPYTNIIRQSVDVYREALVLPGENPESVVAELHHRADFECEDIRRLTALWRAPIIVTTAVAFFETMASNRPATLRRLHELPGSVIFVDEAHASLPLHLLPLAWRWMNTLSREWGCYFVLASGSLVEFWTIDELTQEHPHVPKLIEPALNQALMGYEAHRISFRYQAAPLSRKELIDWVANSPGPRLLIMNTVQSAAVIARDMAKDYGRACVEHLSTALTPMDRDRTIERVRSRLKDQTDTDWTLVATSCVEAGVDFSFRTGFREIASLLSLLQAAGRVSRGGEYENAEMWSFSMQDDGMLKPNPGVRKAVQVLKDYLSNNIPIKPSLSTDAIRRELADGENRRKRRELLQHEDNLAFACVEDLFRVVDSAAVPVIIGSDIAEHVLDRGSWQLLQKHTITIDPCNLEKYHVKELRRGLYQWCLPYDDFIGYMAGALTMSDPLIL